MTARDQVFPQRGFTLLEVMVAMLLLGLFATVSYRALDSVLAADRHGREEMARWQVLSRVFDRLQNDLGALAPVVAAAPGAPRGLRLARSAADVLDLSFDRLLPQDQPGGVQRIGYRFERGALYRLAWREGAPEAEAPARVLLMQGLRQFDWRCLDEAGVWQTQWPAGADAQALPRALETVLQPERGAAIRRVMLLR